MPEPTIVQLTLEQFDQLVTLLTQINNAVIYIMQIALFWIFTEIVKMVYWLFGKVFFGGV